MDYRKIIEDLVDVDVPVGKELRHSAAVSIRELLDQKMKLTSELTLAKKCLEENEEAFASQGKELARLRKLAALVHTGAHNFRVRLQQIYEEVGE